MIFLLAGAVLLLLFAVFASGRLAVVLLIIGCGCYLLLINLLGEQFADYVSYASLTARYAGTASFPTREVVFWNFFTTLYLNGFEFSQIYLLTTGVIVSLILFYSLKSLGDVRLAAAGLAVFLASPFALSLAGNVIRQGLTIAASLGLVFAVLYQERRPRPIEILGFLFGVTIHAPTGLVIAVAVAGAIAAQKFRLQRVVLAGWIALAILSLTSGGLRPGTLLTDLVTSRGDRYLSYLAEGGLQTRLGRIDFILASIAIIGAAIAALGWRSRFVTALLLSNAVFLLFSGVAYSERVALVSWAWGLIAIGIGLANWKPVWQAPAVIAMVAVAFAANLYLSGRLFL